MIKRFNPDFSLSISHELAYMRETPEGGYVAHGDYATLFSELESVKAERDALERQLLISEAKCKGYFSDAATALIKCDALAVENARCRFEVSRCHQTIDEMFKNREKWIDKEWLAAIWSTSKRLMEETPVTDAALAAIEARVWAEAKDLAKSMLASDSADCIDFLFDGKIKQLREAK